MADTQEDPQNTTPSEIKPIGLWGKFKAYIKNNQENNRKAGVKPLSEELGEQGKSWMNGIMDGMAKVGEEETSKLHKDKEKQFKEDEETMDFLIGRKKYSGGNTKPIRYYGKPRTRRCLQKKSSPRWRDDDYVDYEDYGEDPDDTIDYILGRRGRR